MAVDSQFVCVEGNSEFDVNCCVTHIKTMSLLPAAVITAFIDITPACSRFKYSREVFSAVVCFLSFLPGLTMVTHVSGPCTKLYLSGSRTVLTTLFLPFARINAENMNELFSYVGPHAVVHTFAYRVSQENATAPTLQQGKGSFVILLGRQLILLPKKNARARAQTAGRRFVRTAIRAANAGSVIFPSSPRFLCSPFGGMRV